MSVDNNTNNIDLNVDSYSQEDLLELLNLNDRDDDDDDDDNIRYDDIIDASNPLIDKYTSENNYDMANFFRHVQNKLLEDIDDEDVDNIQYTDSTQLGNLWKNQTVSQQNTAPTQSNKVTDRKQKVQIFEQDDKYIMFPNQLGVNNDYQVPVAQGQINPNLKNITTRIINIDSQYRENIIPYNEDPDGPTSPTNFTLDLSDPIRKAISINVTAYQIPYTWYLIDASNRGNNQFYITNNTSGVSTAISISSGNYNNSDLINAVNIATNAVLPKIIFLYNTTTGKTTIRNDDNSNSYTITFYDSSNKVTNSNFSKINNNLGWVLGFRGNTSISQNDSLYGEMIYTLSASGGKTISESLVNTFGSKYFLLVLDDFQQNHLNQGLVGITPTQTNVDIPSYWNADLATSSSECQTQPSSSKKIPTYVQNAPRRLTQAQLYTLNSATQNRSQTTRNRLTSPNNSSVLAVIPLKGSNQLQFGNMLIDDFNLHETERVYFGPVDLERFRVRLVDDQGYTVNLNGNNWSFTMNATCLYQY
jgi:hypothetical protein